MRRLELLAVCLCLHFDEGVRSGSGRQLVDDSSETRQPRRIGYEQLVRRAVRWGVVRTRHVRGEDSEHMPDFSASGPFGGEATLVHDEVDIDGYAALVHIAHRVVPPRRPVGRARRTVVFTIEERDVGDALPRIGKGEIDLHIADSSIGPSPFAQVFQPDTDHVGSDVSHVDDARGFAELHALTLPVTAGSRRS